MNSPVFILSTGRTGTQFFRDYINRTTEQALCTHEPHPSRRFKFQSNLFLNHRISPQRIQKSYTRSRKQLFRELGERQYIESSNFIFGCIPALNGIYSEIRVIHIVRHPVTYVRSHLGKGFWRGHKRFFARYVPYWLEKMEVDNPADPIELLAGRWNYVNLQIESYQQSNPYLRVRFEDLFSGDPRPASDQLNLIREFCGLPTLDGEENSRWLEKPKNVSKHSVDLNSEQKQFIQESTAELMKKYSYDPLV